MGLGSGHYYLFQSWWFVQNVSSNREGNCTFSLPSDWANIFQTGPEGPTSRSTVAIGAWIFTPVKMIEPKNQISLTLFEIKFCEVWIFQKIFSVMQTPWVKPVFGQCSWVLDKHPRDIVPMCVLCSSNALKHCGNVFPHCAQHSNVGPVCSHPVNQCHTRSDDNIRWIRRREWGWPILLATNPPKPLMWLQVKGEAAVFTVNWSTFTHDHLITHYYWIPDKPQNDCAKW